MSKTFLSFWMAGFESACHVNALGHRVDMTAGVRHDRMALEDYSLIATAGIRTARDGIRWHLVDKGSRYDLSSFLPMLDASLQSGIQVVWSLCHYGIPDGLDVFSPEFVGRFGRYARTIARVIADRSGAVPFYTPVNELSFFCWAGASEMMFPFATGRDAEWKQQLVRATIAACEAILDVDPRARFLYPEPLIQVVPPVGRPDLAASAASYTESQYEALDMLAGRIHPSLGGNPRYLDIIGANFYHSNEWDVIQGRLRWEDEPRDPRWIPLHTLLERTWKRYDRPVCIAETSHFGSGRARWILEVTAEVEKALRLGVPIQAVCLYPILDRYDWEDPNHWHNSGLWDIEVPSYRRVLNPDYWNALQQCQQRIAALLSNDAQLAASNVLSSQTPLA